MCMQFSRNCPSGVSRIFLQVFILPYLIITNKMKYSYSTLVHTLYYCVQIAVRSTVDCRLVDLAAKWRGVSLLFVREETCAPFLMSMSVASGNPSMLE